MLKRLLLRLMGLAIASLAFAPAMTAVIKGCPVPIGRVFSGLFRPDWWWTWIWSWMPAVRFPWDSWSDILWSLPGGIAVILFGIGLGLAFGGSPKGKRKHWEVEP
jgi:hypothetical protein